MTFSTALSDSKGSFSATTEKRLVLGRPGRLRSSPRQTRQCSLAQTFLSRGLTLNLGFRLVATVGYLESAATRGASFRRVQHSDSVRAIAAPQLILSDRSLGSLPQSRLLVRRKIVNRLQREESSILLVNLLVVFDPEVKQSLEAYQSNLTLLLLPGFCFRVLCEPSRRHEETHIMVTQQRHEGS